VKNPIAVTGADAPRARVISLEASLSRYQRAHDGVGDVVTALLTFAIEARQSEKRRSGLDHDPSNMGGLGYDPTHATLLDFQTQGLKPRNFGFEARCLVLTAASLTGALRCLSEASMIHDVHLTPSITASDPRYQIVSSE